MLVLSRRLNERIVLPAINATIQVLGVKPGVVRLGIDAPPDVRILREEVQDRTAEWAAKDTAAAENNVLFRLRDLNHRLRNYLNGTNVGLALLSRQLQAGLLEDAQATLAKIDKDFQALQQEDCQAAKVEARPATKSRKSKALLVEDNPNECELLATFLRMADIDVDTAGDGADALEYLHARGRPDVVLLDMGLPRCDGKTTVRAIRRDPAYAGLKIFAVTARAPDEFDLTIGPGGIDRWFRKPLDPAALVRDLNQELNLSPSRS
jgi:carbon storage regulator CsrA